ncbi:MAG: transglycosylase SLT domain-containing protein [Steroidobacteraceae bacterium]
MTASRPTCHWPRWRPSCATSGVTRDPEPPCAARQPLPCCCSPRASCPGPSPAPIARWTLNCAASSRLPSNPRAASTTSTSRRCGSQRWSRACCATSAATGNANRSCTPVHCEAKRVNIPPELVLAVMDVESRFDRFAVSSAGAVGLMQVMPFWPRELGMSNDQLVRIPDNVRMGTTILGYYLRKERGNYQRALQRYNGSLGRPQYSDMVIDRLASRWTLAN